ncbi:polar amino acid transport system substrate-binding protein [Clostridium tetanomorphum]|uniref:Amino acid ABC transporter substrate-binding protein n=1 Tax=Clostridium tetanomorphum TaxID=1553 RepID=A0A923ECB3_CLOTT|nr:amino acid ABC transporter substrate-binding protein [Clostridium tetanomorphum]KAJ49126.1 amino acid ABC transporter periplasmic solute-binding protein [Clostridium tetanomorphum DSM 665]KAJ53048.1 amino acid ABC transporter periplasmic solute-binding protein [Clostridium tetanomorphum DSM 665]MBC2398414.1 amino acid ABC transporter substrate-binding protein [Clostridium tetanomorphum]MBP1865567.1 polar amino acid transport system substrate-binding protein [Clostridium tetanomorphum]NRS865
MKKRFISILTSVFVVSMVLVGCGNSSNANKKDKSLEEIKNKGEFVVGLDDTFAPMGFRDENGEIVGLDIDLAKELGKRMGVKVIFKPVEWDGVIMSLNNKDIDVIWNGLSITEKRKEQIGFSKPYINDKQVVMVQNNSSIKNKKDLDGKIVAIQMGSTSEDAIKTEPDIMKTFKQIKKYGNYAEALMDLKIGRVDAVVIDEIVGRYYGNKKGGSYKFLQDNFGQQAMGVGVRKADVSFRQELDKILDQMKADGTTAKLSEKWFGKDLFIK